MIKALGDTGVNILHSLVNKIYDSGEIPYDMLKSVFIALPKKPNTLDCDQHRTISLKSHTLKLLLKIVLERCRSQIRPEIAQCQCQTKEREMPFSLCGCLSNEAYNTNRTSTSALSITRRRTG